MPSVLCTLAPAEPGDLDAVRDLLRTYQAEIGVDLCFQGFEAEVAGLPGAYAPPRGCLLVLHVGGTVAGCVGMRPFSDDTAEMKRLYLGPAHRGQGLGRTMATAVIDQARRAGYRALRLDTLPSMNEATALYLALGFGQMEPPGEVPVPGMRFFELALGSLPGAHIDFKYRRRSP